jgi:hypothetical protein
VSISINTFQKQLSSETTVKLTETCQHVMPTGILHVQVSRQKDAKNEISLQQQQLNTLLSGPSE